jgi:hypothetical protein
MAEPTPCPVCTTPLENRSDYGEKVYLKCPRCGNFGLTAHAEIAALPNLLSTPRKKSVLSYAISRKTRPSLPGTNTIVFDAEECERIVKADYLPTPQEQGENLIRWLGDHLPDPGRRLRIDFPETGARIGAQSPEGFIFIVQGLLRSGLLLGDLTLGGTADVTLTFPGWRRYEELRRGTPSGRNIFDELKVSTDTLLTELCPTAQTKLTHAIEQANTDKPEGWSSAAMSCRRVLKDFADAVYPARDEPVDGHDVSDAKYINRLYAFAKERGGDALASEELEGLDTTLNRMQTLGSKGVHANITQEEARITIIRTYMLLARLAQLAKQAK